VITADMKAHFFTRTNKHIDLVGKYIDKIIKKVPSLSDLESMKDLHDKGKFEEPEMTPYIWLTWKYKCAREGVPFDVSDELEKKMNDVTIHHIINSKHHPEFWDDEFDPNIMFNDKDRDDVPEKPVNATRMPLIYIAEMIADWCAVAEERKTCPYAWLEKNLNTRWIFSKRQLIFIELLLDNIWNK